MDKKTLQKQRIMTYFIDAANKIIEEEGIEAITIRKAATIAGYNSATLYNYFQNLDHLILFASMKYLKEYTDLLPKYIGNASTSLEKYFSIWECFCTCSFNRPHIYNLIFFSTFRSTLDNLVEEYYEIFPDELLNDSSLDVKHMLLENSIYKRNSLLLQECVNEGSIPNDHIDVINEIAIFTYQGMLNNVLNHLVDKDDIQSYIESLVSYIKFITLKNS
ncbi:MAG: TetR/AcrR family transcriptional regulator [Clostridium sp.]|uniref:TetR/AcrR family transcriptional regulator n=1 Tax=Clostridium sp. TaxID=1506 RepID=UPI003067AB75